MKTRIITAIIGVIAILGLVAAGGWFLTTAVFIVAALSLLEYKEMLAHLDIPIYRDAAVGFLACVIGVTGFYSLRIFLALIILTFVGILCLVPFIKKTGFAPVYIYGLWDSLLRYWFRFTFHIKRKW